MTGLKLIAALALAALGTAASYFGFDLGLSPKPSATVAENAVPNPAPSAAVPNDLPAEAPPAGQLQDMEARLRLAGGRVARQAQEMAELDKQVARLSKLAAGANFAECSSKTAFLRAEASNGKTMILAYRNGWTGEKLVSISAPPVP